MASYIEGMKCPECGATERFAIRCGWFYVSDHWVDDLARESLGIQNSDDCECTECDFYGLVADFKGN